MEEREGEGGVFCTHAEEGVEGGDGLFCTHAEEGGGGGGGVFCTHAATDLRIVFQSVNVVKP